MSKDLIVGRDKALWEELNKLFKLPPRCKAINIYIDVEEVVLINATFYAERGEKLREEEDIIHPPFCK